MRRSSAVPFLAVHASAFTGTPETNQNTPFTVERDKSDNTSVSTIL